MLSAEAMKIEDRRMKNFTGSKISRRDFLKTTAAAAGMLLLPKDVEAKIARTHLAGAAALDNFPDAEFLGRNCSGGILNFRARPSADAEIVRIVFCWPRFHSRKWRRLRNS